MILPPFVGAIGIKQIFGQYGAVNALIVDLGLRPHGWTFDWFAANQFWGIAVVEALSLYPIIYLNAVAALANIDPAMEEAAQNLGCTGLRRFRKITLPLIQPGALRRRHDRLHLGLHRARHARSSSTTAQVTSVQIFYGLKDIGGNPFPYALVAVMLVSSVAHLRRRQGALRPRRLRHDGQGDHGRRAARACRPAQGVALHGALLRP